MRNRPYKTQVVKQLIQLSLNRTNGDLRLREVSGKQETRQIGMSNHLLTAEIYYCRSGEPLCCFYFKRSQGKIFNKPLYFKTHTSNHEIMMRPLKNFVFTEKRVHM